MQNEAKKANINTRINDFTQKNRLFILSAIAAIIVLFFGFIISYSVHNSMQKNSNAKLEDLLNRYESLQPEISSANLDHNNDIDLFLSDLEEFAAKRSGYAAGKAYGMLAGISAIKLDWEASETAWINAAKSSKRTFYEPLAWFNAGVSAEEQESFDAAIGHYKKCLASRSDFPSAIQAQFSIGRLFEELGDKEQQRV